MSKKISIEDVDRLIRLQNKLTKLYEEQDELFQELFDKYGELIDYVPHNDKEHPFLKVSIKSNIAELIAGSDVWKSVKFPKYSFETRPLKKMPKSLEESEKE